MDKILEKWDDILTEVKNEHDITNVSFDTWLKPLVPYKVENDILYISVSSEQGPTALNYVKRRYELAIQVALTEMTGYEYDLEFTLGEQGNGHDAILKKKNPALELAMSDSNLNPAYTFDTFVVGSSNRFAHSASVAVAESPGTAYNPLFIHGSPGLGKTHLMQSIGHYVLDHMPEKKVLYVTSEAFTNDIIDSLRNGNQTAMAKMRNKYRSVDVLMIDDIQFIIGKEATQIEFFNTFEQLHTTGKQIILTSDKPPKDITALDERFRTRFAWGLVADVGYPDYETRMAILRKKSEIFSLTLDDDILNYIATNINSNVRELESALKKLKLYCTLENTNVTMSIAMQELQNIISPDKEREITPQLVIEIVAEHFHISTDQMISKNRRKEIVKPRQIAMYLCREMTDAPLNLIGNLLGRDHSTIIHGSDTILEEVNNNEEMRSQIETIKKKINPN